MNAPRLARGSGSRSRAPNLGAGKLPSSFFQEPSHAYRRQPRPRLRETRRRERLEPAVASAHAAPCSLALVHLAVASGAGLVRPPCCEASRAPRPVPSRRPGRPRGVGRSAREPRHRAPMVAAELGSEPAAAVLGSEPPAVGMRIADAGVCRWDASPEARQRAMPSLSFSEPHLREQELTGDGVPEAGRGEAPGADLAALGICIQFSTFTAAQQQQQPQQQPQQAQQRAQQSILIQVRGLGPESGCSKRGPRKVRSRFLREFPVCQPLAGKGRSLSGPPPALSAASCQLPPAALVACRCPLGTSFLRHGGSGGGAGADSPSASLRGTQTRGAAALGTPSLYLSRTPWGVCCPARRQCCGIPGRSRLAGVR